MEKFSKNKKCFFFFFFFFFFFLSYMCENFSKIEPIIKKIPNFVNDPVKTMLGSDSAVHRRPFEGRHLVICIERPDKDFSRDRDWSFWPGPGLNLDWN